MTEISYRLPYDALPPPIKAAMKPAAPDDEVRLNRIRQQLEDRGFGPSKEGPKLLADLLPGVMERLKERANRW